MKILRNVFRRKMRTALTIAGIVIGVFALIAMGGMSEKITLMVDGGTNYYKDKVIVAEVDLLSANAAVAPLSVKRAKEVDEVKGVAKAFPSIDMKLEEEGKAIQMGQPAMISAVDPQRNKYESFILTFAHGRDLKKGENGKVVLGADLAKTLKGSVGKKIKIRGEKFEVVGVLEKTLTAPDNTASMSLPDAQRLFKNSLPAIVRSQVKTSDLSTSIIAYVKKGYNPDKVAKKVEKEVAGSKAFGPKTFKEQISNAVSIFTSILTLIGAIALLVGGLSIVNTMTMSIAERTKEIGIRKAIGASKRTVIVQFLSESAVIGLIGGILGLVLGATFISIANAGGAKSGTMMFLLTSRLAIGAVLFALILGVMGGFFPAWRASRLDPVEALRYE